jgi:hypothetical protein
MREHIAGWFVAACALSIGAVQPAPASTCAGAFTIRMPDDWRTADRLMLVAGDVSVPKNRTAVLEFHATDGNETAMLGSYGIVAESTTAAGASTFEAMRVNVTRPLRRWLDAHPGSTVCVRVTPVDGSRQPIAGLDWTSRTIEIQAVRDP